MNSKEFAWKLAEELDIHVAMGGSKFFKEAASLLRQQQAEIEAGLELVQKFQDFKINVHISGKRGPEGLREAYSKLSPEARNCITIENEENSWGLNDCLTIGDIVPIVLDIHHFWIREGEYVQPGDDRVKRVVDSWRGVRPAMHYSISREDVLVGHATDTAPAYQTLLVAGYKKQKLRAHSDFYWNQPVTDWALGFWDQFDIQCESKGKNLASQQVYERAKQLGL